MESKTQGSPSHNSPQKSATYLPGFLLGERAHSPMANVFVSVLSPLPTDRRSHDVTFFGHNFRSEMNNKPLASTPLFNNITKESTKNPTIDLMDVLNVSDFKEEHCYENENKQFYSEKNNLFDTPKTAPGLYKCNDKENDPLKTPKTNSRFWITVIGFSATNKDEILAKFTHMESCCGIRQAGPNWAHICFNDPADYHRALLLNGHVSDNGATVRVMNCNDKTILNESISPIYSSSGQGAGVLSKSLCSPNLGQKVSSPNDLLAKRNNIRPMVIKPLPVQGKCNSPTASTSDGIVAKTLEYLFGW